MRHSTPLRSLREGPAAPRVRGSAAGADEPDRPAAGGERLHQGSAPAVEPPHPVTEDAQGVQARVRGGEPHRGVGEHGEGGGRPAPRPEAEHGREPGEGEGGLAALGGQDYAAARAHLEAALAAWRAEGTRGNTALVLRALGHAALGQGDRAAARAYLAENLAESLAVARGEAGHGMVAAPLVAAALEGFAALAAAGARPARAARLAGAAAALRSRAHAPLEPARAAQLERELAPARRALGPERFAAPWAAGRALPLEAAVASALEDAPEAPPAGLRPAAPSGGGPGHPRPRHPCPPGGLTAREAEVLRLLAGGRSNREIAAALGLSVRTAERHVANVYAKLGAHGRAAAAAYAVRHGLV